MIELLLMYTDNYIIIDAPAQTSLVSLELSFEMESGIYKLSVQINILM